jgi:hypothetical protein
MSGCFFRDLQFTFHTKEMVMSIAPVGSVSGASTYLTPIAAKQKTAPDGDGAVESDATKVAESNATEAAESNATEAAEPAKVGSAPKAAPASAAKSSSNADNLTKLRLLASEHLSIGEIAKQLGINVSDVMEEAEAAGVNLNAGSNGSSATSTTRNPAVGNHVNVKV